MRKLVLICISVVSWLCCVDSSPPPSPSPSPSPSFCPIPTPGSELLLTVFPSLLDQCPLSYERKLPLEVSGDFVEKVLTSKWRSNQHTSVLFYASWCPFSNKARLTFEALSNMYPQIDHFAAEYTSITPSLFSRYGIRSLPALLMLNETSLRRFHGKKDMTSFVKFYKETAGAEPAQYIAFDQSQRVIMGDESSIMQSWVGESIHRIWTREPYLLLCSLFLFLKMVIYLFPRTLNLFRTVWASYKPHLNIVHVTDFKRVWTKLKLSKIRNLRRGAHNATIWASSLASVSLGEASTSWFGSR